MEKSNVIPGFKKRIIIVIENIVTRRETSRCFHRYERVTRVVWPRVRVCVCVCASLRYSPAGRVGIGWRGGPIALHEGRRESNADACYFFSPLPLHPISSRLRGVNARVKLISPCLAFMATTQPADCCPWRGGIETGHGIKSNLDGSLLIHTGERCNALTL